MRNLFLSIAQLLIVPCLLISCNKEEGEGGKGSITGTVYKIIEEGSIINVNGTYQFAQDTVFAKDEDVYIRYGNHKNGYDDKTSTAFDGTFEFKYLTDGEYTLFTYSDLSSDKEPVIVTANIEKGKECITEDLYIRDGKNVGKCGVIGQIETIWEKSGSILPGVAVRVFIQKEGSLDVSDTRADAQGTYSFAKLDPNSTYIIYAEDEPEKNSGIYAKKTTVMTGAAGSIVGVTETLRINMY